MLSSTCCVQPAAKTPGSETTSALLPPRLRAHCPARCKAPTPKMISGATNFRSSGCIQLGLDISTLLLGQRCSLAAGRLIKNAAPARISSKSLIARLSTVWTGVTNRYRQVLTYHSTLDWSCNSVGESGMYLVAVLRAIRAVLTHRRYRPELHYMRGPGPKWVERHGR